MSTTPSAPRPAAADEPTTPETTKKANERPKYGPAHRGHGPHAGMTATEKPINFMASLKRLLGTLRPERTKLIFVILMGAIGVVCNVATPKVMARATDAIFAGVIGKQLPSQITVEQAAEWLRSSGHDQLADMISGLPGIVPGVGIDFGRVGEILLIVLALYVGYSLLTFLQHFLLRILLQHAIYRMRAAVSEKLDRLPLSFFDAQPRGELLSRVTNDIDNITQSLQQALSQLINSLLSLIGVGIMMFTVSWQLALITLLIVPLSAVVSMLIGKRAQSKFVAMWKSTGELNSLVEESYTGHELVKVYGRRREVLAQFNETNNELYNAAFSAQFISGTLQPVNMFIGNLNYVVIAVLGGLRVASGTMPLGDVQAFIQYSRNFSQPISQIASMANLLQSGVASAERVFEVLDAPEQSPDEHEQLPVPTQGHVEFDAVDFSYAPDQPLINGLNLEVKPGQTVAIVGHTGAGKTTLVNLLMRFYEIQGGEIRLDGVNITSVPRSELRRQFGMVLQDTWLFGGTIAENIRYGRPEATEAEFDVAVQASYVNRFVSSLPDGFDTVIDEEGSNISAGEKQLLTIARAFIADPTVLILDEATSSVDTRTEVLLQRAMGNLRAGRTAFVIAHRLSTIRNADVILVMEHGKIVEQGSHDALLASHGAYWKLYESQFNAGIEDEATPELGY